MTKDEADNGGPLDFSGEEATSKPKAAAPQVGGEYEQPLDLSQEVPRKPKAVSPQIAGEYDPRPEEDKARRRIAYLLIGLLWFVISAMFGLILLKSIAVADIKDFAVVLGPVVTLVSAATGFYYGTRSTGSIRAGRPPPSPAPPTGAK
ncbi:MAG: hypothetical protein ACREXX_07895 [Gammaproteobacteria bacterium]